MPVAASFLQNRLLFCLCVILMACCTYVKNIPKQFSPLWIRILNYVNDSNKFTIYACTFTCETCVYIRLLFKHIFHYINTLFIQISTYIYYTMDVIVGTNGTSRHEIFVKGDSMAKCSSAGTYDVIFRDRRKIWFFGHCFTLTFTLTFHSLSLSLYSVWYVYTT
jgi:hypothetical protein